MTVILVTTSTQLKMGITVCDIPVYGFDDESPTLKNIMSESHIQVACRRKFVVQSNKSPKKYFAQRLCPLITSDFLMSTLYYVTTRLYFELTICIYMKYYEQLTNTIGSCTLPIQEIP